MAADSCAVGTNREQMVRRTRWRSGCAPRWRGRARVAHGASDAIPDSGGCAASTPSSRTSSAQRLPARRSLRLRPPPASTCTRAPSWRRWWRRPRPATRRAIRPACGRPSSRSDRRPDSSRWRRRCCTGRRRWPARGAPPASSSTAASRGAGAG